MYSPCNDKAGPATHLAVILWTTVLSDYNCRQYLLPSPQPTPLQPAHKHTTLALTSTPSIYTTLPARPQLYTPILVLCEKYYGFPIYWEWNTFSGTCSTFLLVYSIWTRLKLAVMTKVHHYSILGFKKLTFRTIPVCVTINVIPGYPNYSISKKLNSNFHENSEFLNCLCAMS